MKKTKNKVCNKRVKRIVEESYFPATFIDRVNLMYYMNSKKKESKNKDLSKFSQLKLDIQ
tara:strand:+ start:675 stop:854 length:180 start_codon:yes stop_codon:yes gene_type:complete